MGAIIIYGSCYGTAKVYAEVLAEQMKCKVLPYDKVKETDRYETKFWLGQQELNMTLRTFEGLTPLDIAIKYGKKRCGDEIKKYIDRR